MTIPQPKPRQEPARAMIKPSLVQNMSIGPTFHQRESPQKPVLMLKASNSSYRENNTRDPRENNTRDPPPSREDNTRDPPARSKAPLLIKPRPVTRPSPIKLDAPSEQPIIKSGHEKKTTSDGKVSWKPVETRADGQPRSPTYAHRGTWGTNIEPMARGKTAPPSDGSLHPDGVRAEERRLASHDPASSAQCHVLIVLILAILALVYFVIRRLRSRAPATKTRSRVTAKRGPCSCRSPIEHQETEPLRYVVVLRTFAAKPKGGRNSPPSYTL